MKFSYFHDPQDGRPWTTEGRAQYLSSGYESAPLSESRAFGLCLHRVRDMVSDCNVSVYLVAIENCYADGMRWNRGERPSLHDRSQ